MRPGACPPCATGKYQDGTGKSECKDCPAGKTTANTGAAAESDCVAAAATTPAPVLSTPPPCVPSYTTDCTLGLFGGLCPGGDNCSVPCGWPGECAFVNATSAGYTTLNNDACCATPGAAGCEGGQCAPGYMCGWCAPVATLPLPGSTTRASEPAAALSVFAFASLSLARRA